ncbi:MAG: hypothetical protein JXQ90_18410 [Cyclobacteriaceae bacterium]
MNKTLIVAGVLTASGCALSLYVVLRNRGQDKLASELLRELNKRLHPKTSGLLGEAAFDIHYKDELIREGRQIRAIKPQVASDYANEIHSAWNSKSFWRDDINKILGTFSKLQNKVAVSQVAKAYLSNHGINLTDQLTKNLDKEAISKILKIVTPLPPYQ